MTGRYVPTVLTMIAVGLWILVFLSLTNGLTHAQTPAQRHCVWTHINDQGEPNIGEDGDVDFSKGKNWQRVSDEGWELKVANGDNYIFEKCDR